MVGLSTPGSPGVWPQAGEVQPVSAFQFTVWGVRLRRWFGGLLSFCQPSFGVLGFTRLGLTRLGAGW
jgi:hypothetical protein